MRRVRARAGVEAMGGRVDIIIVNWNSGGLLRACLASMTGAEPLAGMVDRLVVVDNASSDDSLRALPAGLPLTLMRNDRNRGFAAACNQGAAGSGTPWLLFLNPDTRALPGWLSRPLAALDRPDLADVGILGVRLLDEEGRVARRCARQPSPGRLLGAMLGLDRLLPGLVRPHFMTEWDHGDSRDVDQVMGAYFLVRRSAFEQLGGFDERYFLYYEDADFARRAAAAGWRSHYLAEAAIHHRGGGVTDQVKGRRLHQLLRSRNLFVAKWFGRGPALGLLLAALLVEPLPRLAAALARDGTRGAVATSEGYGRLWRELPAVLGAAWRAGR